MTKGVARTPRRRSKMRAIAVNVTADCIARGTRFNGALCPVALAIGAATRSKDVWVEVPYAAVKGRAYALPRSIGKFIDAFDYARPVKPVRFTLRREFRED